MSSRRSLSVSDLTMLSAVWQSTSGTAMVGRAQPTILDSRLREDFSVTISADESGWGRRRSLLLEKYEQIAWGLFAKHGFRDVTVEEIAEAAGVSARTLFRYFPIKED